MNQPFGVEISGEINVQKIIGYHGTKERFVDSIINDGFKIAPSKEGDNHWLGHGVYFYSDYELAEWWSRTKVERQNEKYGYNDKPVVIKGHIHAENIWNLDNPFRMKQFKECQKNLEKQFVELGIKLDFTKGKRKLSEKIRCFWMDAVKENENIEVIIYTFSRSNPSYIASEYHVNVVEDFSLANMGLAYHEKQICVTNDKYIIDKCVVSSSINGFDEVII